MKCGALARKTKWRKNLAENGAVAQRKKWRAQLW